MSYAFTIAGVYDDIKRKLFTLDDGGSVVFGWAAKSTERIPNFFDVEFDECIELRDYIMEGFVTYIVRVRDARTGLILEVTLTGSNRDIYVPPTIRDYIKWADLEIVEPS